MLSVGACTNCFCDTPAGVFHRTLRSFQRFVSACLTGATEYMSALGGGFAQLFSALYTRASGVARSCNCLLNEREGNLHCHGCKTAGLPGGLLGGFPGDFAGSPEQHTHRNTHGYRASDREQWILTDETDRAVASLGSALGETVLLSAVASLTLFDLALDLLTLFLAHASAPLNSVLYVDERRD
jgi:hypothetical protein